jgi:hypothetical protein
MVAVFLKNIGKLVCRTGVKDVLLMCVMGWDLITIWKYLVSQNESDGGEWESKASVASDCSVCCALHLLIVVETCCAVWSPPPPLYLAMFLTHDISITIDPQCKAVVKGQQCTCIINITCTLCLWDRLCGLVARVLGYRSGGPGSIPGTTRKKE